MKLKTSFLLAAYFLFLCRMDFAYSDPCQAMPSGYWTPNKKLYTSDAPSASASDPLTIDFAGDALIYATLSSASVDRSSIKYRINVLEKTSDLSNPYTLNCDSDWQNLPQATTRIDYEIVSKNSLAIGWRFQIFDDREAAAISKDPLKVELALGSLGNRFGSPASGNVYLAGVLKPPGSSPALECQVDNWGDDDRPPASPGSAFQGSPPTVSPPSPKPVLLNEDQELSRGVTTIRYVRGQGQLNVRATVEDEKLLGSIKVRVAVKTDGPQSFTDSCDMGLPAYVGKSHSTIIATSTLRQNVPTIWRVETLVDPPASAGYPNPHIKLQLESDAAPSQTAGLQYSEFMCEQQNAERVAGRVSVSKNQFAGSTKLSVDVDDPAKQLTPAAQQKLAQTLLSAIELWRVTCRGCNADNLAVTEIDKQLYLMGPIVEAFRGESPDKYGPFNGTPYEGLFFYLNYKTGGRGVLQPHFVAVSLSDAPVKALCSANPASLPRELQRVQIALACASASNAQSTPLRSASLLLTVLPGFTECGADTNVIACEKDRSIVALNSRDYTFVDAQTNPVFGSGQPKVSLMHVLLHEVGHWIGINHIQSWGNIMSESLSESRCIDDVDANALIVAAGGMQVGAKRLWALYNGTPVTDKGVPPTPPSAVPNTDESRNKPANFRKPDSSTPL